MLKTGESAFKGALVPVGKRGKSRLHGHGPQGNFCCTEMTEAHSLLGEDKKRSFETGSRPRV